MSILENIHGHQDLIKLNAQQRELLCVEIREFMIEHLSKTGGHVASNLGVVELTVAIETVFDTKKDRLVFDVGHQSYIHKLLTDRQAGFDSLRQFGGLAGFPKPSESAADAFTAGHASSSVSIALGMARARTLGNDDYHVIALMGDGAATGGMAYEGLNDAAVSEEPMIIILNDNAMSIDRNVGGMAYHLRQLRTKRRYLGMKRHYRDFLNGIPGGKWVYRFTRILKDRLRRMIIPANIFECMGFASYGPVDGHDTENLIYLLQTARDMHCPVLLHVTTQKGRGYTPAQEHPKLFHGIGKFDPATGEPQKKCSPSFSDSFGSTMVELAAVDRKICAITAAMPGGTGLLTFKQQYPDRIFDVGIAEEHAVSMAGGLAKQGMVPVVAIYSTFLQRAYDMILQDVCMLGLHVVFAVDRAGLVGEDGETHHGIYDIGFLRQAPGMTVLCPASLKEQQQMLQWAVCEYNGPVAVRYPRGGDRTYTDSAWKNEGSVAEQGLLCCHRSGPDVTLITYGAVLDQVMAAAAILEEKGLNTTVLRLLTVQPLPLKEILDNMAHNAPVVVIEEISGNCGVRDTLAYELAKQGTDVRIDGIDLGNRYIQHGSLDALYDHYGLSGNKIAQYVLEVCQNEN